MPNPANPYAELLKHYQTQAMYGGPMGASLAFDPSKRPSPAQHHMNPNNFQQQVAYPNGGMPRNTAAQLSQVANLANSQRLAQQEAFLHQLQIQRQEQERQRQMQHYAMQNRGQQLATPEERNRLAMQARIARQQLEMDKQIGFKTQLLNNTAHQTNHNASANFNTSQNNAATSRNPILSNHLANPSNGNQMRQALPNPRTSMQYGAPPSQSRSSLNTNVTQVKPHGATNTIPPPPPTKTPYSASPNINPHLSSSQLIKQHQKQVSAQTYNPSLQVARRSQQRGEPVANTARRSQPMAINSNVGAQLSDDIQIDSD